MQVGGDKSSLKARADTSARDADVLKRRLSGEPRP